MLKIKNIKKAFGSTTILANVSCEAAPGKLTILEGKNGAGKSTLFNLIAGIIHQDEGEILLQDVNIGTMSGLRRASLIALLKQDPKASSVSELSILDNFALALLKGKSSALTLATPAKTSRLIHDHVANLTITVADFNKPIGMLSGGQRQIIAFAMATIVTPKLLLLDEPTAALDEESSHLLMTLIKQFAARLQIPAVMISHDHELNRKYADEIFILSGGAVEKLS